MEIRATNINDAFDKGVSLLASPLWTREVAPRGAITREVTEPIITHYTHPRERVLFSPARDANPFLHFFESLWMLAGRRDVAFVKLFASRMTEFSDNGVDFNGAYGWRWRHYFCQDQLEEVKDLLKRDPDSRRAVITMWYPTDLSHGAMTSKDVPCNTQVYVKIRDGKLDLTVTCRSNDILWGAHGTNVVQFSMLQEYLANKLGVQVGRLTQYSDSFHVYLPPHPGGQVWRRVLEGHVPGIDPYGYGVAPHVQPYPLGAESAEWDADMKRFFEDVDAFLEQTRGPKPSLFQTPFWQDVVRPMWLAWYSRSTVILSDCAASDWRLVCTEWLERRAAQKGDK